MSGSMALGLSQKRRMRPASLLVLALVFCAVELISSFGLAQVTTVRNDPLLAANTELPATPAATTQGGVLSRSPLTASILVYVICFVISSREPPPAAGKPPKLAPDVPPFHVRKDIAGVFFMSILLSFVSGIVNAMAIIAMGGTVAHHTGNASHVGRLLGEDAARFASLMVAYLAGSAVAGYFNVDGEALFNRRYSPSLLSAAFAVASGGIIHNASGNALVALPLLSFSQGIQNAITRRCASLPVCTTHMTGYLTDAGVGLGQWAKTGGREPLSIRTKFFLLSIIAFVVGGTAAKGLLDSFGILSSIVPALAMAICALGLCPMPSPAKDV